MKTMTRLISIEQLEEAVTQSSENPLLLFKHSTRCPISAHAYEEVQAYLEAAPNEQVNYSIVLVIEDRAVSTAAAERLGIRHESPQTILVKNGLPVWHTSHSGITSRDLSSVLSST